MEEEEEGERGGGGGASIKTFESIKTKILNKK